jgi:hypothetical protein
MDLPLSGSRRCTDTRSMRRLVCSAAMAIAIFVVTAAPAHADATAFWGVSPSPAKRSVKGFAFGLSLLVVGFEFEYAHTSENDLDVAPGLTTGMINAQIQTPTHTQFYLTAGGGFYRERLATFSETNFGTNVGGGVKLGLVGPLRLRIDYRKFALRGEPINRAPSRFYVGANLSF